MFVVLIHGVTISVYMMDDKIDKLLEDVAVIRTTVSMHSEELKELKENLKPVFFQITGFRWAVRTITVLVGVGSCIAAFAALFH